MDRATLRSELLDLAGLDLTSTEANRLLNEGHTELCVRGEWTKANVNFGPTVAGTNTYNFPTSPFTVHRPLNLAVDSVPYEPSDAETARFLRTGDYRLRAYGIWYLTFSSAGVEAIALYPTPETSDLTIVATSVVYPAQMTTDAAVPAVPEDFHRALVDYAAAIAFGADEDNAELRAYHMDAFDRTVSRLRRHRLSRAGRGPVQMRVVGVHV